MTTPANDGPITPTGKTIWTTDAIRGLGMTTDLDTAASILGIGRTLAYDLVREGRFPVRLLRLGRRVLVPTHDLIALLTNGTTDAAAPHA